MLWLVLSTASALKTPPFRLKGVEGGRSIPCPFLNRGVYHLLLCCHSFLKDAFSRPRERENSSAGRCMSLSRILFMEIKTATILLAIKYNGSYALLVF